MRKMYVGNIPYNAAEEDLREMFSEIGEIESLKIRGGYGGGMGTGRGRR
jgi:RNA recognition motif-containing protein